MTLSRNVAGVLYVLCTVLDLAVMWKNHMMWMLPVFVAVVGCSMLFERRRRLARNVTPFPRGVYRTGGWRGYE